MFILLFFAFWLLSFAFEGLDCVSIVRQGEDMLGKPAVGVSHPSVVNLKFIVELEVRTAGPSTTLVAKNAPSFAQDDSVFC